MILGYEPFSEAEDQINGIAAVPKTSNTVQVSVLPLKNADLISDLDFIFRFTGTTNAYTSTVAASAYFPYLFVGKLTVPYQSGSIKIWEDIDGHMGAMINLIRGDNRRQDVRQEIDQTFINNTGYTPQTGDLYSAANYTVGASGSPDYRFRLRVSPGQYFATYLDKIEAVDQKSNTPQVQINPYSDVFASYLAMASTGRNITPVVQLNPVYGTLGNQSPITATGAGTAPTWTDAGSVLTVRREGIRTPGAGQTPPPAFAWASNWRQISFPIASSKLTIPIPAEGQLLAMIGRLFDPTLASGVGAPIDLVTGTANLQDTFVFKVGSGITRNSDSPASITERLLKNRGQKATKGVFIWDWVSEEALGGGGGAVNGAYVVDTYTTATPLVTINLGSAPGAGSICDCGFQYLSGIA